MSDMESKIDQAGGSYKVYLAIKSDGKLKDRFTANTKGTLFFNSRPMSEHAFSEVAVYLARTWRVVATAEEMRMGMMAAAKLVKPHMRYGVDVSDELEGKIKNWLTDNEPSVYNYEITTEVVAIAVAPEQTKNNRRLMEMKIARVLRANGLEKARVTYNGKRRVRWFPADSMI
jgi:hypothetical protein|tara:strand:+ start:687 stop:1205 length:519 start_codon:yes stop_codon:yes gene_type:complete